MNYLSKPKQTYEKKYKQKEHGILLYIVRGASGLFILIAWLVYFKEELDKQKFKIKALEEDNQRKDYAIGLKDEACNKYRKQLKEIDEYQKKNKLIVEQTKRLDIYGDYAKTEETRVCEGNLNLINNLLNWG